MIEVELIEKGLNLIEQERALKNQLKELRKEIDLLFNDLSRGDMFELMLTWKDVHDSLRIIDPIDLSDYEYESTDDSDVTLYAIRATSDNFPEVKRLLENFGYEAREDNNNAIIFWELNGVVAPMLSSFGYYILFFPEPRTVSKVITDYSPSLFQTRYRKTDKERIGEEKRIK